MSATTKSTASAHVLVVRSGLALLLAIAAPLVSASILTTPEQTLTFDTLTNTDAQHVDTTVPLGYGAFTSGAVSFAGFNWAAGGVPISVGRSTDTSLPSNGPGYINGTTLPVVPPGLTPNFAYRRVPPGGLNLPFSTIAAVSGTFVFRGAFLTAAFNPPDIGFPPNTVQTLTLQGYLGADLRDTLTVTLSAFSRVPVSVNWENIDHLVLTTTVTDGTTTFAPLQWVMDDFRYAVAVPEPASALYLLLGFGLLCAMRLRR